MRESTMFGIAYNFGQFAVGYSQNDMKIKMVRHITDTKIITSLYGVTFAASDSLTLGVSYRRT